MTPVAIFSKASRDLEADLGADCFYIIPYSVISDVINKLMPDRKQALDSDGVTKV